MTTVSSHPIRPASGDAPPRQPPAPAGIGPVLRAIARKDSREIAAITGLIALAYGGVLVAQHYNTLRGIDREPGYVVQTAALSQFFLTGTAIMGPIAALIIGVAQFFFDSRPDRFGLLTHRPASRSLIFFAKIATGIAMYLAAMFIPLFANLWWASDPAHIPLPFSWWMALTPIADVFSGIPYYFAGVLVSRRTDASWYGSRLVPIAAPIIASGGNVASPHFGWAILWIAIATVIMATAARAYFAAGGQYARLARHAKPFTGVILFAGLITVGAAAVGLIDSMLPVQTRTALIQRHAGYLKDGTPIFIDIAQSGKGVAKDLAGNTLMEIDSNVLYGTGDPTLHATSISDFDPSRYAQRFHEPYRYFYGESTAPDGVAWFRSMSATGGNYLVGYDRAARRLVGSIGANGFEPGVAAPAARFTTPMIVVGGISVGPGYLTGGPRLGTLIGSGDTLYRMTGVHDIEPVFTTPGHEKIIGVGRLFYSADISDKPEIVAVYPVIQTAAAVMLLSPEAKPGVFIRYEMPQIADYQVAVLRLKESGAFILEFVQNRPSSESPARKLAYFKPDGTFDHAVDLGPVALDRVVYGVPNFIEGTVGPMLCPPAGIAFAGAITAVLESPENFARSKVEIMHFLLLSTGFSVFVAIGTFLLAQRRQMGPRIWLWTLLAFLLGPVGLLLMLCLPGLPVTVPCPNCRRPRRVDQSVCPHCATPIAAPAKNGTEIFV